ncbi:MAG: HTH domain-containing protein [Candidatus Lokiarchaeota archaeon]|nr:HTH domain-containing protein [Candidatus Lokiarchaeota archaeon]
MSDKTSTYKNIEQLSRKELILNKIKENIYGINISQIAEELKMNRITIKNYVEDLKKENKIIIQKIGRSKICFMKNYMIELDKYEDLFMDGLSYFLKSFDEVISPSLKDPEVKMKEIGKNMRKFVKLPELTIINNKNIKLNKREALDRMADVGLTILNMITHIGLKRGYENLIKAKKGDFIEDNEGIGISLKIEFSPFDFLNTGFFYHLGAGFFEAMLQENFGKDVHFNVHIIPPEKYVCYYKITIE